MRERADYDVAIVGYGPVGELAAIMLARRGHRVAVIERWASVYPLPRAVVYDDEIARVFEQEGLLEDVRDITDPVPDHYEWRNRHGQALLKIDWSVVGPTGRQVANFFSQPELQAVLDRHARAKDGVDLHLGWQLEDLHQDAESVTLDLRRGSTDAGRWELTDETRRMTARYVIGADGANSVVRRRLGIENEDLGFNFDWLICDVQAHEQREWRPMNWQLCDPARPTTIVSGGPGRRRWEFMRLPGESIPELNTDETAWRLLEPWGRTPANTTLERHAVYTFQARWAKEWRKGRVLLAGDAAHLMPPFAGQGMCGGLRDVSNLVWKLDLVLRNQAAEALLDTYGGERSPHVQSYIHLSMALGQVICVLDEDAAAARDARMIAGGADPAKVLPAGPPPKLGPGALSDHPLAGTSMTQGRVAVDGRVGLLDELLPSGFVMLARDETRVRQLADVAGGADAALDLRILAVGAPQVDVDGHYRAFFDEHGVDYVVLRPDNYVYGLTSGPDAGRALLDGLVRDLRLVHAPAAA